eukprot:CAMPEP_0184312850 /NCGR_PEP_ID=MMETSP1049-20130417/54974_1 /TAXON_ID=77928 /ORGANISM="Proteomonas sulcata, Strain CCMP704" /LENGTH=47 /DNA_ID= /DNA_START= /DNA_END= /DNA_ORIENTATION=
MLNPQSFASGESKAGTPNAKGLGPKGFSDPDGLRSAASGFGGEEFRS